MRTRKRAPCAVRSAFSSVLSSCLVYDEEAAILVGRPAASNLVDSGIAPAVIETPRCLGRPLAVVVAEAVTARSVAACAVHTVGAAIGDTVVAIVTLLAAFHDAVTADRAGSDAAGHIVGAA